MASSIRGPAVWVGSSTGITACRLRELFRIRQVPRLVFANACFSSAAGHISTSPDDHVGQRKRLVGIARALFARGIPNFIGTGWKSTTPTHASVPTGSTLTSSDSINPMVVQPLSIALSRHQRLAARRRRSRIRFQEGFVDLGRLPALRASGGSTPSAVAAIC